MQPQDSDIVTYDSGKEHYDIWVNPELWMEPWDKSVVIYGSIKELWVDPSEKSVVSYGPIQELCMEPWDKSVVANRLCKDLWVEP